MTVATRFRTGDPLRHAVGQRGASVERRGDLEPYPRPAARHARDEADVELARFVLHHAMLEADSGGFERRAAAGGFGIRVAHGSNDPFHARLNDCF